MANDYLISKWKMWFHSVDVNHSGTLTKQDIDECKNRFAEFNHLNEKQKTEVNKEFEKLWNEFILRGKSEVSEEDFVHMLNEDFKKDKDELAKRMQEYCKGLINLADLHHEGSINKEEWMALVKAYGHTNLAEDEKFFEAFNPVNGKIPVQKVIDAIVQFSISEDSTIPDVSKQAFDAGF